MAHNKKSKWPRGWFQMPGVQLGDRSVDEQMLGLANALRWANGKTVLDLGCAEGLIADEFARAGASLVHGVDYNKHFVDTANAMKHERCEFFYGDLSQPTVPSWVLPRYDIVLMLAILHKLPDANFMLREYASRAGYLVVRLPRKSIGVVWHKHSSGSQRKFCDVNTTLDESGFDLQEQLPGPRGELVQHWVRSAIATGDDS